MKYKIGQIVFFKWTDGLFMKAIYLYNKLKYGIGTPTHIGIIIDVKKNGDPIIAEVLNSFVIRTHEVWQLDEWLKNGDIEIGECTKSLKGIDKCVADDLGKPYGYLDLLAIALTFLFKFKIVKATGATKVICSEAVARAIKECNGLDISKDLDKSMDLITPIDLYRWDKVKILTP